MTSVLAAALVLGSSALPARAVLDVDDRGPLMDAGNFRMRVTNAGILGNAFYNVGRSSDPSFEYPAYSGIELLNHADLWVGGLDADGQPHVSGGPLLEWRPTLDPEDHVRLRRRTDPGTKRRVDDDGDGKVDEEILNGKDDDGDGEIDEDIGMFSDQMSAADYVDDRPEAVNFGYSTGETHKPLGLSVHQETYAWSVPGYDGVCGITFHITNHTQGPIRQLYVGLLADLDSRRRADPTGHQNDRIEWHSYAASKFEGLSKLTINGVIPCGGPPPCPPVPCYSNFAGTVPAVVDGDPSSGLPVIAVMPLDHTLDPLSRVDPSYGRAPYQHTFMSSVFLADGIPGQGGVPALDADRYTAMAGNYPNASTEFAGDWVVLLSCGPFRTLDAGESIDFTCALVAAPNGDSLDAVMSRVVLLHHGYRLDVLPNATAHPDSADYQIGESGVSGHEVCLEPPPSITFTLDPDCVTKFPIDARPDPVFHTYHHGQCFWTDLDCDQCTGLNGQETTVNWNDPGETPPAPNSHIAPGDHRIEVQWDNQPEVLVNGGQIGAPGSTFVGYRLYKLARWDPRAGLMPPAQNWSLLATFSSQTGNGEVPLTSVTDTTLDYDRILYEQKHYPIGRYHYTDPEVLNGFDYVYALGSIIDEKLPVSPGVFETVRFETPLIASFDQRVTPHTAATATAGKVTVVPNPYRAHAGWDRPAIFGDPLPRHVDFMHLPMGTSTIKIYTLAGDFVAQLTHDGRSGDGQEPWNLISRNGQDVESGVYLFTVDSKEGHQIGKFVLVR